MNKNSINSAKGFSLVELAVVVVILGMLMSFGIKLASTFQDRSFSSTTREKQAAIKQALISYLAQKGRLPCPATFTAGTIPSGAENPANGGNCVSNPGIVPYQELGLTRDAVLDGWDRFFIYEVTNQNHACAYNWTTISYFVAGNNTTPKTYHDGESGCVTVNDDVLGDGAATPDITRANDVAVVISNGRNGLGGYTPKGTVFAFNEADTAASREQNNIPTHSAKVAHVFQTEPITLQGFDDIVMELSANDLLTPIKRDGSIISINQLARNALEGFNNAACNLTFPTGVTKTPAAGVNQASVTLTASVTPWAVPATATISQTINAGSYGCATGFNY